MSKAKDDPSIIPQHSSSPITHSNLYTLCKSKDINQAARIRTLSSESKALSSTPQSANSNIKNNSITEKSLELNTAVKTKSLTANFEEHESRSIDTPATESQSTTKPSVSKSTKENSNSNLLSSWTSSVCKYINSNISTGSKSQTVIKSTTRSKVYRKASLKTPENPNQKKPSFKPRSFSADLPASVIFDTPLSQAAKKESRSCLCDDNAKSTGVENHAGSESKIKWNEEDVHITCNPLSTPYPYSTPCHKDERIRVTQTQEEEPKAHSCGNFLPILSLIPLTLVSFQYLSPKMKFSWWRNKIS